MHGEVKARHPWRPENHTSKGEKALQFQFQRLISSKIFHSYYTASSQLRKPLVVSYYTSNSSKCPMACIRMVF
jgi:hypothetical protein